MNWFHIVLSINREGEILDVIILYHSEPYHTALQQRFAAALKCDMKYLCNDQVTSQFHEIFWEIRYGQLEHRRGLYILF